MIEERPFNQNATLQDLSNTLKDVANNVSYYGGFNARAQERGQRISEFRKVVKGWIEEDRVQNLEEENKALRAKNEELVAKVERLKISLNRNYGPLVSHHNLDC